MVPQTTTTTAPDAVTFPDLIEQVEASRSAVCAAHQAMPTPRDSYANLPAWYIARATEALTAAATFLQRADELQKTAIKPCV